MGGHVCKCDRCGRSDQQDDNDTVAVETAVEVRLGPQDTTDFDIPAVIPDYFDSLQWATSSDPCADNGIAIPTQGLCDSWVEKFTDQEIQQLETDAVCVVRKHADECHEIIQPCIVETKDEQPAVSFLVGNASCQPSEKKEVLDLHMDTVVGALAGGVQNDEAYVLPTELLEGSTHPSENNFLYCPNHVFQEASGDVNISDQCTCMSAVTDVHCTGNSEKNSDTLVQAQGGGESPKRCQGHGLQGAASLQPSVQAEGVVDVTMQCSPPGKLHHISVWYHVGAKEDEDLDGTEAQQVIGPQSAGCDAVRHPQLPSPKRKISSRRASHAKAHAAMRGMYRTEDVLLW
mmetsp:Transcript_16666/g.32605  ORF Transcript_16666/g.32605 Transcript_16666/m.32605 type:complete len:345 (+) Transcript_16666:50-1084(+)